MNDEVWTKETAEYWGIRLSKFRNYLRVTRLYRHCLAFFAVLYAFGSVTSVLTEPPNYQVALLNMLLTWLSYRMQLLAKLTAEKWTSIVHHGQRMLNETTERAYWHATQVRQLLHDLYEA